MVVSNMPKPATSETKGKKGKAKPILVSPEALAEIRSAEKNFPVNAVIHPEFYATILESIANDPNNVLTVNGVPTLKRANYTDALRQGLARGFSYNGELARVGVRGGNVIGVMTAFNSIVGGMFEFARMFAGDMPEEQVKAMAFAKAKESLSQHPQLKDIEISDEALDDIWNGNEVELTTEDDEGEDEEDDDNEPS